MVMYKGLKEQVNTNKIVAKSTVKSRVKKQIKSKYFFKTSKTQQYEVKLYIQSTIQV